MFEPAVYQKRRAELMERVGSGLILLYGNGELPINFKANTYPFRQDSTLLYYAGLKRPNLALLLDVDAGKTYLCGQEHSLEDVIWMGPQAGLEELARCSAIDGVLSLSAMANRLAKAGNRLHFLPPYRCEQEARLSDWLGIPVENLKANSSQSLILAVVAQRSRKDAREVAEIEKALKVTASLHLSIMTQQLAGRKDYELVEEARFRAALKGCSFAYAPILTAEGQILHKHRRGELLREGRLLLNDMGAETETGYAADITRTFPVSKTFTTQQRELYEIVLQAQEKAIAACKPGRPFRDVHLLAATALTEGLKALGLMKGDVEEAVSVGAHALFFPHGLGHMMGLDVHDMENLGEDKVGYDENFRRSEQFGLAYLRLARPLQKGFVVTVEPGLYFIPSLMEKWAAEKKHENFICYEAVNQYLDFGGIRIEDNILITDSGCKVLGDVHIPKSVADIEALRGESLF